MITIGARRSPLARAQADLVAGHLRDAGHEVEIVGITTTGDTDQRALTSIGGTGVFAAQVRRDLREGRIDIAVHSLKDLPVEPEPGLVVAAIPPREDVRDVLVGARLDNLREGMRVGTGSPRRAVQFQSWAAGQGIDVTIEPIRGNIDTRIGLVRGTRSAEGLDAVILAAAGLRRLERIMTDADGISTVSGLVADPIPTIAMLPAAGQGALAVEISEDADLALVEAVAALDDPVTRACVSSERVFLAAIEAGCLAPVGVLGRISHSDLTLSAVIGRTVVDNADPGAAGLVQVTTTGSAVDAPGVGRQLAETALAELRVAEG